MERCVLAVDLGASSGRVIAGMIRHDELVMEEIHRFQHESVACCDTLYWDVLYLFSQIKLGINLACKKYEVCSLAMDTWGVDFGLLDKQGKLVENPISYRDHRTSKIIQEIEKTISKKQCYEKTGNTPDEINTLMQLVALKKQRPEILEKAETLLFMPDLFGYFLTGNKACEFTIASTSQCLNITRDGLETELLQQLGIKTSLFAPLRYPLFELGHIKKEIQQECGCQDIPVILCASHDTASAVVALPTQHDYPLFISCGTWSIVGQVIDLPLINEKGWQSGFSNEGCLGGRTRVIKNLTGLWIIQQCRSELQRQGKTYSYDEIEAMMDQVTDYPGFIDTQDEVFRTPGDMIGKIHHYCKQHELPIPVNDAQLFRCIYQSLAAQYRLAIQEIEENTGHSCDELCLVGGGSQSATLCQMTADATKKRVISGPVEATALGNLAVSMVALGWVDMEECKEKMLKSQNIKIVEPSALQQTC